MTAGAAGERAALPRAGAGGTGRQHAGFREAAGAAGAGLGAGAGAAGAAAAQTGAAAGALAGRGAADAGRAAAPHAGADEAADRLRRGPAAPSRPGEGHGRAAGAADAVRALGGAGESLSAGQVTLKPSPTETCTTVSSTSES